MHERKDFSDAIDDALGVERSRGPSVFNGGEPLGLTSGTTGDVTTAIRVGSVRERFEDDPQCGFKTAGHWLQAVRTAEVSPTTLSVDESQRLRFLAAAGSAAGMSQDVGSAGGFAAPAAFVNKVWNELSGAGDSLLGRTTRFPVEGESLTLPANAETSRATGSRYGGIQGYWISEAATITPSNPTLRQLKLEPCEVAALVPVSDKLLRNAPALEGYVTRAAVEELNFLVDDAIVSGTGVGQPLGITGSAGRVTVGAGSGQAAATIIKKNIDKMYARCHARARLNAVWLINQDVENELANMTQDVGTGGSAVYLPVGGLSASPFATLKGLPVIPTEHNPTVGTEGDIILANLGYYIAGIGGGGVQSASSIHVYFTSAQTAFRFLIAVDGRPALQSPITPFNGTNTLSPFVTLATRS
jgi:HK97 family phage major capsid protein